MVSKIDTLFLAFSVSSLIIYYLSININIGQYGIKDLTTNKWNGIIGQLADKLADIAVGPVSVMAEREGVVDCKCILLYTDYLCFF